MVESSTGDNKEIEHYSSNVHVHRNHDYNGAERDRKRVIVVGVPGVGKTTVISQAAHMLNQQNTSTNVVVFGTLMFEESKRMGLKNRDEMRKLPIERQRHLQDLAAEKIVAMKEQVVVVDTHLFIKTSDGFYPGIPMRLMNILRPTNFIMIAANADEIAKRRESDNSRRRDLVAVQDVQAELDISRIMITCCSILSGSPFMIVMNKQNEIDHAALAIANLVMGMSN